MGGAVKCFYIQVLIEGSNFKCAGVVSDHPPSVRCESLEGYYLFDLQILTLRAGYIPTQGGFFAPMYLIIIFSNSEKIPQWGALLHIL